MKKNSTKRDPKEKKYSQLFYRLNGHGVSYKNKSFVKKIKEEIEYHLNIKLNYHSRGEWGVVFITPNKKKIYKVEAYDLDRDKKRYPIRQLLRQIEIPILLQFKKPSKHIPIIDKKNIYMMSDFMYKDHKHQLTIVQMPNYGVSLELESLDEDRAKKLFNQMLLALKSISKYQLIHNDISNNNFLINSKGKITLIDFGLSVQNPTDRKGGCGLNGTLDFISLNVEYGICASYRDDVESCAFLAWGLFEKLPWIDLDSQSRIFLKKTLYSAPDWIKEIVQKARATPFNKFPKIRPIK